MKYAIEMLNITKTFDDGKLIANDNVSLKVKENEIHAIIGENGAGKSTLMSILFGLHHQDKGLIKVRDKKVKFKNAHDASKHKIGMVHQHFQLIEAYTVWENIIIGFEKTYKFGKFDSLVIDKKAIKQELKELIAKYKLEVDLDAKVEDISIGTQQKVEILKLLYNNADILIFDEPTAILSDFEIKNFLKILENFKKENKTIIIITHKLYEVKKVADQVTVLRHGKVVGNFLAQEKSIEEMTQMMVGRKLEQIVNNVKYDKSNVILEVKDLWLRNNEDGFLLKDINFKVHQGEILGIAGVEGNGQSELALTLGGLLHNEYGSIKYNKREISNWSVKSRIYSGISHVPEDRHKYGLFLDANSLDNCMAQIIDKKRFGRFNLLNKFEMERWAKKIINLFDVRGTNNGKAMTRQLSGGNQQKLILGREITKRHNLLILVQPTRGLDLGAVNLIQQAILAEAAKGKAIVLISYDLDEILSLSSTVAVMSQNVITKIADVKDVTRKEIAFAMVQENDVIFNEKLKLNSKNKIKDIFKMKGVNNEQPIR